MSDFWKDLRAFNVGGSEAAALFDESPYMSLYKLWHIKRGNIPPDMLDDDPRVQGGKFLERGIIDWANSLWKTDFYQPQVYVEHSTVKGMGCTPDAYSASDPHIMAQIKNVDLYQFTEEKGWKFQGEVITAAPLHILIQVQHEMEVCQKQESLLIVCVGGNRLFRMTCERDSDIGAMLRINVKEFWNMPEPDPNFKTDGKIIRTIKSKLNFKDCLDYSNDKELYALLKKSVSLKTRIGNLQDRLDAVDNQILAAYEGANIKCKDIFLHYKPKKEGISFKITMLENNF